MSKLQPVRGTKDIFGEEVKKFANIVIAAKKTGALYGFEPLYTPIFEDTSVFSRTLGEESDVVNKEMYTFETKGGESITLRPEFTAGIVRAFISNGMQQNLPCKFFSYGPVFRYERPQKGRQRQFHQVNFEQFGNSSPITDAEMILLAAQLLENLGITKNVELNINTLGDAPSRKAYEQALVAYLNNFKNELSEDSQRRLIKNPLRILDSKDDGDKKIVANAPKISDYLNEESKNFFDEVISALKKNLKFPFKINEKIVRGLDYYTHTVFEFIVDSEELGAQNTILAGGRYDGLVKQMGGSDTPAVGFAAGVERLMLLSDVQNYDDSLVAVICDDNSKALETIQALRKNNIGAELILTGNFRKKLQKADKLGASHILFVFEDGLELKDMKSGTQEKTTIDAVIKILKL